MNHTSAPTGAPNAAPPQRPGRALGESLAGSESGMPDPNALVAALSSVRRGAQELYQAAEANHALYTPGQIATVLTEASLAIEALACLAGDRAIWHLEMMRGRGEIPAASGRPGRPLTETGSVTHAAMYGVVCEAGRAADTIAAAAREIAQIEYSGYRDQGPMLQLVALGVHLRERAVTAELAPHTFGPATAMITISRDGKQARAYRHPRTGALTLEARDGAGTWVPVRLPACGISGSVHPAALAEAVLRALDEHEAAGACGPGLEAADDGSRWA